MRSVEVSTDGGRSWRPARLADEPHQDSWVRWSVDWTPERAGDAVLTARATDSTGAVQPARTTHNEQGYLFDAWVRHPVSVTTR